MQKEREDFTKEINNLKTGLEATKKDVAKANEMGNKYTSLEYKVKLLETENILKEDKIETLTSIIVGMPKNLNAVDGNSRSCCVIVTGVPEDDMTSSATNDNTETTPLTTDYDKVKEILKLTENSYSTADGINDFEISRLGKTRQGSNRAIKIKLPSKKERDEFLKGGNKLKTLNDPWKKIYIKKDLHPVYNQENTRMRKKFYALKSDPNNANKEIKLEKGILTIDGIPVDKNTFFC